MSTTVFDINEMLQKKGATNNEETVNERMTFEVVWREVKSYFDDLYNPANTTSSIPHDEIRKHQEYEHDAILGKKESEKFLMNEIEEYLRNQNLLGIAYPNYYNGLAEACFHEIYKFGSFHQWQQYPDSPSAKIVGDEIWFKIKGKFKLMGHLRSEKHVEEIIRTLQIGEESLIINSANPHAEVDMTDGTRVTILIPPRSHKPTIIFRRFVVKTFSFLEQAKFKTIDQEDIPFFETLAKLQLNTIIAGPVESGKSTFLKTMYGSRDEDLVAVLIESSPETFLKRDFPNRLVHDFYTMNSAVEDVFRAVLRVDHDYVIVQEVRGIEAEGAILATERGRRGLLMTYHITDPRRTPEQLARHILDEFPNRKETNQIRRVANQIDVGITMEAPPELGGSQKRVTSIYEICYDFEKDEAWINYLMKYDRVNDKWFYNSNVSQLLKDRMYHHDRSLADQFLAHLNKKASEYPLLGETKFNCLFKED
ncbi:ATPase, T2SS/T4P/T4SS family (plasmid) [Alkalihalophilus sp. As8PL]|uniref:ATPase, T2SS/T4P/T4SS family n=1 Tax=Alkalihalophilus sp. As8PL TaxID=3237103 RepID=A0AB39BMT7_9BACI